MIDLEKLARQAMKERGFLPDFPDAVLKEMDRISGPSPLSGLKDLSSFLWISIDNSDSRDLDQLTYVASNTLYIAIADVDALVPQGSALDDYAQTNTTSVYTPAKVFTMLPSPLCYDFSSLVANEHRAAMVVEIAFGGAGEMVHFSLYPAQVLNRGKLSYDEASDWLSHPEKGPPEITAQLQLQESLAETLRRQRHLAGALSLETIELRAVMKEKAVIGLQETVKTRAHLLIEDFMIVANTATTRFLEERGYPSLRRVVKTPKNWDRICQIAHQLGTELPQSPIARALEAFLNLERHQNPLTFPELSLTIIKLLGRGEYVAHLPGEKSEGHFGLALRDYSHATAPNRRFPDLVTQRLIKTAIHRTKAPYSFEELRALAERCTAKEDGAEKIERQMKKSAAALLLQDQQGKSFDAIVTGTGKNGTWVRLLKPPIEGRLLDGDRGLEVGDRLRVTLIHTDPLHGFIDFSRIFL